MIIAASLALEFPTARSVPLEFLAKDRRPWKFRKPVGPGIPGYRITGLGTPGPKTAPWDFRFPKSSYYPRIPGNMIDDLKAFAYAITGPESTGYTIGRGLLDGPVG